MKLIRITSDNDSAIFETQFNESINIKPMSKIALNNFSANLKPTQIACFSQSITYTITWGSGNDDFITGVGDITNGTYNRNNFWSMLDEITRQFNSKLKFNNLLNDVNLLGGQWDCSVKDKRININYQIGYNQTGVEDNFRLSSTVEEDPADGTLGMLSGFSNTPAVNNCCLSKYNTSMGNGYIRSQIYKLESITNPVAGLTNQGFLIGLSSDVLPNIDPSEFKQDSITYGLGVGYNTTTSLWEFYTRQGSVITGLGIAPEYAYESDTSNSFVEVMVNGSSIDFYYTNITNTRILLFTYLHNSATKLYPFYVFHSNESKVLLSYNEFTFDPFVNPTVSHKRDITNPNNLYVNPNDWSVKQLLFPSKELTDFLGFDLKGFFFLGTDIGYTISPSEPGGYNFIGTELFKPSLSKRNFILELIGRNIESYDSSQKQRKNIISSVITSNSEELIENEPNLIFLDLNNKDPIDLRNITMRLVDTEYKPVELLGISVASLLLADENERSF